MKQTIISVFENVRNSKTPIGSTTIWDMVTSIKHKELVELYRTFAKNDPRAINIKERVLPAFTASGLFSTRQRDGLINHSGFICLDFDNVDNPEVLKYKLSSIEFIAFASLSVGGKGVFALVRIADSSKHSEYFKALVEFFDSMGMQIDKHCSDMSRLRVVSYDSKPYINLSSKVWDRVPIYRYVRQETPLYSGGDYEQRLFFAGLDYINRYDVDITQGYANWLSLGSCIKSIFGESGRDYYHQISRFHPKYNSEQCDRRWRTLSSSGYHIGVFAKACSGAGVPKLKELLRW